MGDIHLITILVVCVGGTILTTAAMADDVDDITKATLEHFATLNAGNAAAHVQHHAVVHRTFGREGGLLEEVDSPEKEKNSLQAQFEAGFKTNLQLRHLQVKVYGNMAVVTGYMVGTVTSPDGGTQEVADRRTAVLIKQNGQWKEVRLPSSPLMTPSPG